MDNPKLFNQRAEEAVIGAFLKDHELVRESTLKQEHFYLYNLAILFRTIRQLDEKGEKIDIITVTNEIGVENLDLVGGVSYIFYLMNCFAKTDNYFSYEKIVKEYYQKRKAIEVAGKIIQDATDEDVSKTLSSGISALMAIEDEQTDDDYGDILPCLADLYLECEKDQDDIAGIPSGFTILDRLTGGFQESDLVIIGARPSMGKTAFALNIALNAAEYDLSVIF